MSSAYPVSWGIRESDAGRGGNWLRQSLRAIFVQLVKQKLVHACRLAISVVRHVYAFRNYLSEFLRHSDKLGASPWMFERL